MDQRHFDHLVRELGRFETRRDLLRHLVALPLLGVLAVLLGQDGTASADGSGAWVRGRHHHRTRRRPHHRDHHPHHRSGHHGHHGHHGHQASKANGQPCTAGRECQSTFCVENICCNNACAGGCATCATGTCTPIPGTCTTTSDCCGGVCTCGSNPEAGHCQVPFTQDFSSNTEGWNNVTQGDNVGIVAQDSGAFTRWGGYSTVFPEGGYTTTLDIYLDLTAAGDDTRFDWSSAVSTPGCAHRRDFVFNVGFFSGTATCAIGSGERFVINGSTNATRSGANPCTQSAITITSSGWYTFSHHFTNDGGVLVATLQLRPQGGTGSPLGGWVLSDPSDVIGTTVGGNRYGSFFDQEFPQLRIDNSARS